MFFFCRVVLCCVVFFVDVVVLCVVVVLCCVSVMCCCCVVFCCVVVLFLLCYRFVFLLKLYCGLDFRPAKQNTAKQCFLSVVFHWCVWWQGWCDVGGDGCMCKLLHFRGRFLS